MANKVKLSEWLAYLDSRVDVDIYVWGGNGECIVTLFPKLTSMEKSIGDVDRVLTLLNKRLLNQIQDIFQIRGEDCSGLAIKFLLDNEIIKSDMTANGLWEYIVGNPEKGIKAHGKKISLKNVRAGDYLFQGSDSNKYHVGYAVDKDYAIESKNHDVGVVKTKIADRGWKYAARPDWYEGVSPEPEKPVLKRELRLTDPYMKGEDVREAQRLLTEKGYNCGEIDGVFGKKTEIATKNFQTDNNLTADGIIGKNTAIRLGFKWEG